jgi:hypothetical protein
MQKRPVARGPGARRGQWMCVAAQRRSTLTPLTRFVRVHVDHPAPPRMHEVPRTKPGTRGKPYHTEHQPETASTHKRLPRRATTRTAARTPILRAQPPQAQLGSASPQASGGAGARGLAGPPAIREPAPAGRAAPGGPAGPPWTGHSTAGLRARAPAGRRPSARRAPGRVRGACGPGSPRHKPPGGGSSRKLSKVCAGLLLHGSSCQSHGERPWTLRGLHAPKFGHHLDTAGLSEPHI